jgi:hypothetical protein
MKKSTGNKMANRFSLKPALILLVTLGLFGFQLRTLGRGFSPTASPENFDKPPVLMDIKPEFFFAPTGFDSNDNAQLVIDGNYINTCFKVGPVLTKVDSENKKIYLRNQAYYYPDCWCLYVLVPYTQVVNLGILKPGIYDIIASDENANFNSIGSLNVAKNQTSNPDNFFYAAVEEAQFLKTETPGYPIIILRGTLPSECMEIREIRVVRNSPNVIELLPIMTVRESGCDSTKSTSFQKTISLENLSEGKYLIHVRSLNGQSINKVVSYP